MLSWGQAFGISVLLSFLLPSQIGKRPWVGERLPHDFFHHAPRITVANRMYVSEHWFAHFWGPYFTFNWNSAESRRYYPYFTDEKDEALESVNGEAQSRPAWPTSLVDRQRARKAPGTCWSNARQTERAKSWSHSEVFSYFVASASSLPFSPKRRKIKGYKFVMLTRLLYYSLIIIHVPWLKLVLLIRAFTWSYAGWIGSRDLVYSSVAVGDNVVFEIFQETKSWVYSI